MSPTWTKFRTKRITGLLALFGLLILLLVPTISRAEAPPDQQGNDAEPCALCHWGETSAWEQSPHANNGIACEHCHGTYVEDHPSEGIMQLTVDSGQCSECHVSTHQQWQSSRHATADVNCINCHVTHSQTTRLQSEQLCCTCHTDGFGDGCGSTAHNLAGVTCLDCHVSQPHQSVPGEADAPSHTFTAMPAHLCMDCHSDSLHEPIENTMIAAQDSHLLASQKNMASQTERVSELSERLESARKQNTSYQFLALMLLGLGIGVGLIMGIVVVLIISYIGGKQEAAS